jgi:hypothetical protein
VIYWDEEPQPEVAEVPEDPNEAHPAGQTLDDPPPRRPSRTEPRLRPGNIVMSGDDVEPDSDSPKPPLRAAE